MSIPIGDPPPASGPDWLSCWQARPITSSEALNHFRSLQGIEPEQMIGRWRGASLATGHPLDGLLEALDWYGKAVESPERVHPLLFRLRTGRVAPLDPALMPTAVALGWPAFARSAPVRAAFAALGPALVARGPAARLAARDFEGRRGIALVYDRQPIVDHLRSIDSDHVIGLMERKGMASPFFFLLARDAPD